MQKLNTVTSNPLVQIYTALMIEAIEERRVRLEMANLIPEITNFDGLDIGTREVAFRRMDYEGKAIITDLLPNKVPTLTYAEEVVRVPLKFISSGIETTENDKVDIETKKLKPLNRVVNCMRIIAEEEDKFIKSGFSKLGIKGLDQVEGINVVPAGGAWSAMTGAEILEEIRILIQAHTMDGRFMADELWLDRELYNLLQKPYSATEPKTVATLLEERKWVGVVKDVMNLGSAIVVEKNPSNFGYVNPLPISLGASYMDGTTEVQKVQEKVSSFIMLVPESMTKSVGAM